MKAQRSIVQAETLKPERVGWRWLQLASGEMVLTFWNGGPTVDIYHFAEQVKEDA